MNARPVRGVPLPRARELCTVTAPDKATLGRGHEFVLRRITHNLRKFRTQFPAPSSVNGRYDAIDNVEWTNGFWTGMLWLAYETTGERLFRDAAEMHVESFARRLRDRVNLDHHDLGFLYSLSCVSAFKLTGSEHARDVALGAARLLLDRYLPAAGIIQAWGDLGDPQQRGRMIIDCNLNLPLLFWAGRMTGNSEFELAARRHLERAAECLVRPDASTFHTYYLDPVTGAPLRGSTHQGYSDDSCWARGQAWAIYGFALGYRHTGEERYLALSKKLAGYFLSHLPADRICHWDLVFTNGSSQPRDSSAAAIAACGLLELVELMPDDDADRETYCGAATAIVTELTTNYLERRAGGNGVLAHAVYHMPNGVGVDESCIWGDYFFFEALMRMSGCWRPYW